MTTQGSPVVVAAAGQRPVRTVGVGGVERMETKEDRVVRIGFNNINGIGAKANDVKNVEIHGFMRQGNFDIFGMSETNIHWRNNNTQPKDIMYGWFQRMNISQRYYKEYPMSGKHQVGGVLQVAIGDFTTRIKSCGGDEAGLGRWTWQVFTGSAQRNVRIVTAYRPVRNTANAGSVWHQHQYYADCNDLQGSPHDRWIQDLKSELQVWLDQGDSIILMADFNEDV
jgi:hypothetical protein